MLTEFGKLLRKIRIDNEELLRDMAAKLNVTPSYLSVVETGKRNIPEEWLDMIVRGYDLDTEEQKDLKESFFNSQNQVKFELSSMEYNDKDLVLAFAREFTNLNTKDKNKIFTILRKHNG